jgi:hypothetical protein
VVAEGIASGRLFEHPQHPWTPVWLLHGALRTLASAITQDSASAHTLLDARIGPKKVRAELQRGDSEASPDGALPVRGSSKAAHDVTHAVFGDCWEFGDYGGAEPY